MKATLSENGNSAPTYEDAPHSVGNGARTNEDAPHSVGNGARTYEDAPYSVGNGAPTYKDALHSIGNGASTYGDALSLQRFALRKEIEAFLFLGAAKVRQRFYIGKTRFTECLQK